LPVIFYMHGHKRGYMKLFIKVKCVGYIFLVAWMNIGESFIPGRVIDVRYYGP